MTRCLSLLLVAGLAVACGPPPESPTPPSSTAGSRAEPTLPPSASTPSASDSALATAPTPPEASASAGKPPAARPTTGTLPPLPAGTTVLHVGDSMADALGKDLRIELEKRGVRNVLKYKEATFIPQWAGYSMNFRQLVAINDPDLVIITLGGNEVGMPDPTVRAKEIRTIVQIVGDRPCIWIAAPLWGKHTGILEVIRDNCSPCRFVDTNVLIPDLKRLGDKVHPTIAERRRWARFMVHWLAHNRDLDGKRPWDLKPELSSPPPGWTLP